MTVVDPRFATYRAGRTRFMDLDLVVAPGALIPRAETELLGRSAVRILGEAGTAAPRVIDMCCGAGNLACGIAASVPEALVWASDLTEGAIGVARTNLRELGLEHRVTVLQGDLFAPLAGLHLDGTIDLIVCNPPYISSGKLARESATLLELEPREAFDGGPYGLSILQRVVRESVPFLRPGGTVLVEVGVGQARQVATLFDRVRAYEGVLSITDEAGEARVVSARRTAIA